MFLLFLAVQNDQGVLERHLNKSSAPYAKHFDAQVAQAHENDMHVYAVRAHLCRALCRDVCRAAQTRLQTCMETDLIGCEPTLMPVGVGVELNFNSQR